eukprot:5162224-Amphidinium_carterae.1
MACGFPKSRAQRLRCAEAREAKFTRMLEEDWKSTTELLSVAACLSRCDHGIWTLKGLSLPTQGFGKERARDEGPICPWSVFRRRVAPSQVKLSSSSILEQLATPTLREALFPILGSMMIVVYFAGLIARESAAVEVPLGPVQQAIQPGSQRRCCPSTGALGEALESW